MLSTIQRKILLPAALPAQQRKQLSSPRHAHKLRADPITIVVDGETHRFGHMDLMRDFPSTRRLAFAAVDAMAAARDWTNLPLLLEGLRTAGRRLRPYDLRKIARRAAAAGNDDIYAVLGCARAAGRTGFVLADAQTVNEILAFVQERAVDAGWEAARTRQMLAWAEMVGDMLEDEAHGRRHAPKRGAGHAVPVRGLLPLGRDPTLTAAKLNMAASHAAKNRRGEDLPGGEVARYARDLVGLWPAGAGLLTLYPAEAYEAKREMAYLKDANKLLVVGAPILHGMDMAMQVVDADLAAQLKSRRDALAAEVEKALETPGKRGLDTYNKYFRPELVAKPPAREDGEAEG